MEGKEWLFELCCHPCHASIKLRPLKENAQSAFHGDAPGGLCSDVLGAAIIDTGNCKLRAVVPCTEWALKETSCTFRLTGQRRNKNQSSKEMETEESQLESEIIPMKASSSGRQHCDIWG